MSRKTVPFKMPVRETGRRQQGPKSAAGDQTAEPRPSVSRASDAAGADYRHWVQTGDTAPAAEHASNAASPAAPLVTKRANPDSTAGWDLWEVTALLLALPPMLGCLWLLNFYRAKFASQQ